MTTSLSLAYHLLPCFYKQVFGISCPLCGGQRSVLLLFEGRFWESVKMFPPLFPLAITLLLVLVIRWQKPKEGKRMIHGALIVDGALLLFNMVYQNLVN